MPLPSLNSKHQNIAYMSALNFIMWICKVRGLSFPVAEPHINPDKTLLNKSKTVKQLVWLHAVCLRLVYILCH